MFTITNEAPHHAGAIEALLDDGFGAEQSQRTVYRLRLGAPVPELSLVGRAHRHIAADTSQICGSLRFWSITIGGHLPAVLLGPLVVDAEMRGQGLGRSLIRSGLERARELGWGICLVVGDAAFYEPFGFTSARENGFSLPGPVDNSRFQVKFLAPAWRLALPAPEQRCLLPWRRVRPSIFDVLGQSNAA
jgi:predicted N-acetyltransferase YhbS